jgi:uncharacterized protein (UPF0335 family)
VAKHEGSYGVETIYIYIYILYIKKTKRSGKNTIAKKIYKKAKGKTFNQKVQKKIQDFRKQETRKKESLSVIWKRE